MVKASGFAAECDVWDHGSEIKKQELHHVFLVGGSREQVMTFTGRSERRTDELKTDEFCICGDR